MTINGNELIVLILVILALSIFIDLIFGELPTKIHPVIFIGKLIDIFSNHLVNIKNRLIGLILTLLVSFIAIAVFSIILFLASFNTIIFVLIASILLSSTFSVKMLLSSAKQIKNDLKTGIDTARKSMSYLVSRNTDDLSEKLIISATIETLSENITDSAIAPIFYYILSSTILIIILMTTKIIVPIFSATIVIFNSLTIFLVIVSILVAMFYRIINTLDAMVGYKNKKYIKIGYFPAKLDDILNYIPARFGGITIVLASKLYEIWGMEGKEGINWKNSYNVMRKDARKPPSPNSGFTMAAVAGALNISLIKRGVYIIGDNDNNRELKREDIEKSVRLSRLGIALPIIFLILILIFLIFSISIMF